MLLLPLPDSTLLVLCYYAFAIIVVVKNKMNKFNEIMGIQTFLIQGHIGPATLMRQIKSTKNEMKEEYQHFGQT